MRVIPTDLPGVVVIEPAVHRDGRGFFVETYHADRYREQTQDIVNRLVGADSGQSLRANEMIRASDKEFQDLLLNYPRPPKRFFRAEENQDNVISEWMIRDGNGNELKPDNTSATGKSTLRFREPTWDELRGLTADQRRAILEYFKRINAGTP